MTRRVTIGGRGGITKKKYITLQQHYGDAIRAHKGDLEGMVRACWAVFDHSISTDEAPSHDNCPKGDKSWCKYQVAIAGMVAPPPHMPPDDSKRLIPLRLAQ